MLLWLLFLFLNIHPRFDRHGDDVDEEDGRGENLGKFTTHIQTVGRGRQLRAVLQAGDIVDSVRSTHCVRCAPRAGRLKDLRPAWPSAGVALAAPSACFCGPSAGFGLLVAANRRRRDGGAALCLLCSHSVNFV